MQMRELASTGRREGNAESFPAKAVHWSGFLLVLAVHCAVLYALWRYRDISPPNEAKVLIVSLIDSPPAARPRVLNAPKRPAHHRAPESRTLAPEASMPILPSTPPEPLVVLPERPAAPRPVMLSTALSASCPGRVPPLYPPRSMLMNEQGKVVLRVELGTDGYINFATVATSSGYPSLDASALDAVKKWHCNPAVRDGVPVRAVALQPFNFVLEGG